MLRKFIRPPSKQLLRAGYATKPRRGVPKGPPREPAKGPRNTLPRHQQPSHIPKGPENSPGLPRQEPSKVEAVSDALRDTNSAENNLLSPVHIPEDPNGVLNERHPATAILANSSIVVQRQLELMNVML